MFQSCRFELQQEFFATSAKCINHGDAEARSECLQQTDEERVENKALCNDQRRARKEVCELLDENRYDPEGLLDNARFLSQPDSLS